MKRDNNILEDLVVLLLREWKSFDDYSDYFLNTFLPDLKNEKSDAVITETEKILITLIKLNATENEWENLSKFILNAHKKKKSVNIDLSDVYDLISEKIDLEFINKRLNQGYELFDQYSNLLPKKYIRPTTTEAIKERDSKNLRKIELLLKKFDFKAAEELFEEFDRSTIMEKYVDLETKYKRKYSDQKTNEIRDYLQKWDFLSANSFYLECNNLIPKEVFFKERSKYYKEALRSIEPHLKKFEFALADKKAKEIFGEVVIEYEELKMRYITDFLLINDRLNFTKEQCKKLAESLVEYSSKLNNDFKSNNILNFFLTRIRNTRLPYILNFFLLKSVIDCDCRKINDFDKKIFLRRVEHFLDQSVKHKKIEEFVWDIFDIIPDLITKINFRNDKTKDLIDHWIPFEKMDLLEIIGFPGEKTILKRIVGNHDARKIPINQYTKKLLKEKKYYNALMIMALLEAKSAEENINENDVFVLLKDIMRMIFDYRSIEKTKTENLIFPRCTDQDGAYKFDPVQNNMIFCEGFLWHNNQGVPIVLCRNSKCKKRTGEVQKKGAVSENSVFGIVLNQIDLKFEKFRNRKDFSIVMGAFNRWNEICERLICGFAETTGCKRPLTYSSGNYDQVGFAAYATTYWRCSDIKCDQKDKEIKISHCKGCGKIIDSRIDKIRCSRNDNKSFYICVDCGYCCQQHEVSGHCPRCGHFEMNNVDEFGKRFQCAKCRHEINIPSWFKSKMKGKSNLIKMDFP